MAAVYRPEEAHGEWSPGPSVKAAPMVQVRPAWLLGWRRMLSSETTCEGLKTSLLFGLRTRLKVSLGQVEKSKAMKKTREPK